MGIDFTYFGLMTAIFRLYPQFTSNGSIRELYFESARRLLSELREMESYALEAYDIRNAYCLSVCW